ncbi:MAG: S9 family peptidase [Candidatus Cloacimonadota bacterium]|nr:S9 family peptidase [Candidatus Cloacimonadota bacterium]
MKYKKNFLINVLFGVFISLIILILSCAESNHFESQKFILNEKPKPPIAKVISHKTVIHGDTLLDNYYWLKDKTRTDTEVIEYINAENEYTEKMLKHTESLQETLFDEIVSRIQETDLSVPTKIDDYYYYTKREKGKQYWVYCRKKESLEAEEEIVLDANELGKGHSYFSVGGMKLSSNHQYLAYSVDTTGDEKYTLYIKDLKSSELLEDKTYPVCSIVWANDSRTLFYTIEDESGRADKLYRHTLGTNTENDDLIYQEGDNAFDVWIYKSRSKEYLILTTGSETTYEIRYLKANNPFDEFQIIQPRERGHRYYVCPHINKFFIVSNDNAKNYKVMMTSVQHPGKENWEEFIAPRDSVSIDIDVFKNYMVIYERVNALEKIRILNLSTNEDYYIDFPEPIYTIYSGRNPNFDTHIFRFTYESMVMPYSVYDYNMKTREKELKKQQEVLGGYDASLYKSERIFAQAKDSTLIPISLGYKKDLFKKNGGNPLLLYAYGSYGDCSEPYFSSIRLSLLDRDFVYAIAHVRGGGELGEEWYEQGKLLNKKNTFTDFIACAEYLIEEQYTSKKKLVIEGASAGGLLIGAVTNMRPDLFEVVIADVPAVDVINTMLDTSLGGVEWHYDELGNPNDKEYFDYMKSYCPYQNVEAKGYPNMLVLAGFYDPRVNYWEPAKWVAKLRALKTNDNILLLKTDMSSGHGGASGRYDFYKEIALKYAFIFNILGIER